ADPQRELVERRPRHREREAAQRLEARPRVLRAGEVQARELLEAPPPEQAQVDGEGERDEALVRADVRRRPVPPDVLLARRQRQAVAAAAGLVHGLADQAPGDLPDEVGARREQAYAGAAERRRDRQADALAD